MDVMEFIEEIKTLKQHVFTIGPQFMIALMRYEESLKRDIQDSDNLELAIKNTMPHWGSQARAVFQDILNYLDRDAGLSCSHHFPDWGMAVRYCSHCGIKARWSHEARDWEPAAN